MVNTEHSRRQNEETEARADKKRLKEASLEFKKEALAKLKEHDANAKNGPDGAQKGQALPDTVKVKATAEPTSKPQNTQKGHHAENG